MFWKQNSPYSLCHFYDINLIVFVDYNELIYLTDRCLVIQAMNENCCPVLLDRMFYRQNDNVLQTRFNETSAVILAFYSFDPLEKH